MTTKNHGTFLRADTDNHPPGVVADYVDVTDQGSDPAAPASGHHAVYSKIGGLYIENSAGSVVGPITAGGLSNPMTTTGDIIYSSDNSGTPARRAIGGSNTVLHGGTTPAWATVTESDLTFSNITTANATTSLHGLLPRLNGSNTYFLAGDGVYRVPAGGGSSPLTTKGDVWGYSSVDARIPIGTDTYVLTADSTQTLGLKWAAPAAGGGSSLLAITSYAGTSTPTTTSGTMVDVDATHLTVTFTAPASGNVLVVLAAVAKVSNSANYLVFGLRESTTILTPQHLVTQTTTVLLCTARLYVTGISAGSHTYKFAWYTGGGATGSIFTDAVDGPAVIEVWSAP